ncbi:pH-response regulator protein palA/rim20 [Balamuthia mandrillaris]
MQPSVLPTSEMLFVPYKTSDKVNMVKALKKYMTKHFSADLVEQHKEALDRLQSTRESLRSTTEKTEHAKDLYLYYYGLLGCLDKRFPIKDSGEVRLQFAWYDAFKQKKNTQANLEYEKACVLFNIGAVYSQIAHIQNRNTVEGIKKACHYFQLSAGCFEKLRENLQKYPLQPSTPDLTDEFLHMIVTLLLAQAQECFCEKAIKDNMSATIVAMVTQQAADFYDNAYNMMIGGIIKDNLDKNWSKYAYLKSMYFKSLSCHRSAEAAHTKDQYGLQVGYLQLALSCLNNESVKSQLKKSTSEFQSWMNALITLVEKSFVVAEKDNDSIYHERVPKFTEIPPATKKAMVQPLPMPDTTLVGERDPFRSLVPFATLQSVTIYNEKKAELLRDSMQQINEHNDMAKGSLSSMNLPAAIESLETPEGIPESLRLQMEVVRKDGGADYLSELMETLQNLSAEDQRILTEAIKYLDEEEAEDTDVRRQFGDRWDRPLSHNLAKNLREDSAKYKSNMEHALKSDEIVRTKFLKHREAIDILCKPEKELAAMMPPDKEPSQPAKEAIAALRQSLGHLDSCIAERGELESELKALVEADDIASVLLSSDKAPELIYQEELRKYEDIQRRLQANFQQQKQLLDNISSENAAFDATKDLNEHSRRREELVRHLSLAYSAFKETKANLQEGIEFYTNFQDLLKNLRTKCKDFAWARSSEKRDLLNRIQMSATGFSLPQSQSQHSYSPQQQQTQPPVQSHPHPQTGYSMPGSWQPHIAPVYDRNPASFGGGSLQHQQAYQASAPHPYSPYASPQSGYHGQPQQGSHSPSSPYYGGSYQQH